jgi:hypothetical protein
MADEIKEKRMKLFLKRELEDMSMSFHLSGTEKNILFVLNDLFPFPYL